MAPIPEDLRDFAKNMNNEVMIWYKSYCPFCNKVRVLKEFVSYLPKHFLNNRNNKKRYKICSKLTIKTPERRHFPCFGAFIINFECISVFDVEFEQSNVCWVKVFKKT